MLIIQYYSLHCSSTVPVEIELYLHSNDITFYDKSYLTFHDISKYIYYQTHHPLLGYPFYLFPLNNYTWITSSTKPGIYFTVNDKDYQYPSVTVTMLPTRGTLIDIINKQPILTVPYTLWECYYTLPILDMKWNLSPFQIYSTTSHLCPTL